MTRRHLPLAILLALLAWGPVPAAAQASDPLVDFLERLTEAPGPPGFEGAVREVVEDELGAFGARIGHDGLGSVVADFPEWQDGPRIMVTGHMDGVGLMVQHVRDDGFLTFKTLGGWFDQALVDQRWLVLTRDGERIPAVSGLRTVHVFGGDDRGRVWDVDELFLDVGARSADEVRRMGIRPGDGVAPLSPFLEMPNGRYAAKSWDDRVGVAVMIEAVRRMRERGVTPPNVPVLVATVQEEVGLRGAETATRLADPALGISIEAGVASDYPGARPTQAQERLGEGPGIFLLDSSMIPNKKLRDFFFRVAEEEGIPLQADVLTGYGEDGARIQRYDTGRPAVNMTVPTRYLHAHTGIVQRSDFDRAVELLIAVLRRLDRETVERLSSF